MIAIGPQNTSIFKGKSVVFLEKPLRVDSGLRTPRALLLSANPFTPGPAGAGEQENVAIRGQAGVLRTGHTAKKYNFRPGIRFFAPWWARA